GDYGGNGFTSALYVDERGSARKIGIPDIVMNHLKVPQIFSGISVGGNEAGTEEIVARAVAAILIDRRRAKGHVYDAALLIDSEKAPNVNARAILPTVAGPGVMIFFARLGNGVERPDQLAGSHVPGTNVAGGTMRRIFLRSAAGDDEIFIHDWR